VYFIVNLNRLKVHYKQVGVGILILMIVTFAVNAMMDGVLVERAKSIFPSMDQLSGIELIDVHKEDLSVTYNGKTVHFEYDIESMDQLCRVTDEDGTKLGIEQPQGGFATFADPEFSGLRFGYGQFQEDEVFLAILQEGIQFNYYLSDDGFKFINQYGTVIEPAEVELFGFKNYQMMGSNRGYIWSRTLPLIKENLLFGSGPDSYVFRFPQTDYIAKGLYYQEYKKIVDKPHNQFIGMVIEFGLAGLILFLAMIIKTLVSSRGNLRFVAFAAVIFTFLFYDISVNSGWLPFCMCVMMCSDGLRALRSN